jgi:hypothetical protein
VIVFGAVAASALLGSATSQAADESFMAPKWRR